MNGRITIWVISCLICSLSTVALLFGLSNRIKTSPGSFLREFPPHPVIEGDSLNLGFDSYYIAGGKGHTIYFANYTAPQRMIVLNSITLDTQHVRLQVKGIEQQKFWSAQVKVDSPNYFLVDGAVPVIYRGSTQDWQAEKYLFDTVFFRSLLPLNHSSFVVKSLSGRTGENILGKITERYPYATFTSTILQKQLDGVFCTDGVMRYSREHNQILYAYYYRNEYMVMDTNLNLLYRRHTIDTTSKARIKTGLIESENARILMSPPLFVNKGFDVSGNWLFIHSNTRAKNEHPKAFANGAVIDVYHLDSGKYVFSYYIYHYRNEKEMTEFRVFGDRMIVRFGDVVRIYQLVPFYFNRQDQIVSNEAGH